MIFKGYYENEETAAHASDTLARKLMANGEQNHKLNFPEDDTEVFPVKVTAQLGKININFEKFTTIEKKSSSQYIGVKKESKSANWRAQRHSKLEKTMIYYGTYDNEEAAARASDTLARKLLANGEQNHRLNFSNDDTEIFPEEVTEQLGKINISKNLR